MKSILKKIYYKDKQSCLNDILDKYNKQGYVIVNYLYFANCMKYRLFESKETDQQRKYYDSLLNGDFLLPDGIALQVFYYFCGIFYSDINKTWLNNLNGTDFAPYFLTNLKDFDLVLYGAKDDVLENAVAYIKNKFGVDTLYYQNGYSDFDFSAFETSLIKKYSNLDNKINPTVFLIGRGTPLQEVWLKDNIENLKRYDLMCFSQGGTFDFWGGTEKRAPSILVKLRIFETFWRIITNPKKNLPKFLSMFGVFRVIFKMIFGKI